MPANPSYPPPASGSLTPGEMLIWTGQSLDPKAPLYNMAMALDIDGALDATALQEALSTVVGEADSLRTIISDQSGVPTRVVLDHQEVEVDVIDVPEAQRATAEVARLLEARARRIFDPGTMMTDVVLFRLGPDRSILLLNQHHLITDAASTGLLLRRLATEYSAILAGTSRTEKKPPQYRDHVARLGRLVSAPEFDRAMKYWESGRLHGRPEVSFYGSLSIGTGRTHRVRVSLKPSRTSALDELIQRPYFRALTHDHSRFLIFATVLSAWHSRVSDRSRIAIGTPSHNRTTADARETLGLFIELYPLRLEVAADETFSTLAAKVGAGTLDMLRHVVPGASSSLTARDFRVVLNYITAQIGDFSGMGARTDWVHSGFGDRAHALRLQVHDFDNSGAPTLDFDLDTAVFGETEREWAVDHFFALFDHLVDNPEMLISAIPLVSHEDEAAFARQGAQVAAGPGILSRIWEWAKRHPDDPAVVEDGRTVSFATLAHRVEAVADRLGAEGVGLGSVVGVCAERGIDQIAAILGTLLSGAAYLPLDPAHPDDRLAWQVEDSGVEIVLTPKEHEVRVVDWGVRTLAVEPTRVEPDLPKKIDSSAGWSDGSPDSLAYVLYTSGSTGRPKGVEVTRASLADYVTWASRTYDGGDRLSWAYFTSPAYDLTVTSVLTPLVSGGVVVCYADPAEGAGLLVRDIVADDRVDVVKLTPSHLELLRGLDCSRSRIRHLVLGGENLKSSTALTAHASFSGEVEIYNEYGPTEATVACLIHRFDPERDVTGSVPIGLPADNVRVAVLGPGGTPTVRGESGEICLSGPRVARGYRGRPELTAQSFVRDPVVEGERMYRTGDVGRWSSDGILEFLGRNDAQLKVGGMRIEAGEVETALRLHPGVHDAVVLLVETDVGSEGLRCQRCGLEASHPEAQIGESGLCSICVRFESERERVADYFGTIEDLQLLLRDAAVRSSSEHDCVMLYSGGKDSTYALCRIVELGANPLVFLLDNGFISDQAKDNVRRVTELLGLELVIGSTPAMPGIFAESLSRFSNVCQGCFKTVYTLALNLAVERGIGAIVTGLSRGQIFETRLADAYRGQVYDPVAVDQTILDARKAYHRMEDAVGGLFETGEKSVDQVLDTVTFIDFYRYTNVALSDVLRYVAEHTPWIRPTDTGRSTNCLINEAGIFVHLAERGFHNYALPYSWDVRLGHKERDAAIAELDDQLNPATIRQMLDQVGYRERPGLQAEARLVAYYTGDEVPSAELRQVLGSRLPKAAIPSTFVHLDVMPLSDSGKVDRASLPVPKPSRPTMAAPFVEARTPIEKTLVKIWASTLGLSSVGIHDDFFEIGGESLRCVQIASAARAQGLAFTPRDLFANPTVARLSEVVRATSPGTQLAAAEVSTDELDSLSKEFGQ